MKTSYKSSGVDISKGESFVDSIKPLVKQTFSTSVLSGIGNFGAFFKPEFRKYRNPVLISSVDGVGTKIKLAAIADKYDTVGEDLVNHCVNDIAVCGATPLFFLDYYATGKLNNKNAFDIVKGLARGCRNNNCSLIGGETAEMPGLYVKNDFDLAGAIVGIADKTKIIDKINVRRKDICIGIKSSGLHTNGYSLVRKIFDTKSKFFKYYNTLNSRLIDELLKVHLSYLDLIKESTKRFRINSISHITGGGIEGNTNRVIPKNLKLRIIWNSWDRPEIFNIIQKTGNVAESDMRRTFNLGIGLLIIISPQILDKYLSFLKRRKENYNIVGEIG